MNLDELFFLHEKIQPILASTWKLLRLIWVLKRFSCRWQILSFSLTYTHAHKHTNWVCLLISPSRKTNAKYPLHCLEMICNSSWQSNPFSFHERFHSLYSLSTLNLRSKHLEWILFFCVCFKEKDLLAQFRSMFTNHHQSCFVCVYYYCYCWKMKIWRYRGCYSRRKAWIAICPFSIHLHLLFYALLFYGPNMRQATKWGGRRIWK
jgi:hypothetical protein